MTDSSTGGPLVPSSTAPAYDADLEDILHDLVVGLTGLTGPMVRPRWQPNPPPQPSGDTNWCAIGTQTIVSDDYPFEIHDGSADGGLGTSEQIRTETIEVVASFYGPGGQGYASMTRDGLYLPQNGEGIGAYGLVLHEVASIQQAPALINEVWIRKFDLRFTLRRLVRRTYPIRNLQSTTGALETETFSQDFTTEQ